MPSTRSNIKRVRSVKPKTERNDLVRARVRTTLKNAHQALTDGDKAVATVAVGAAVQQLDRAVTKKILHKNNAARRKSRLHKQLGTLEVAK